MRAALCKSLDGPDGIVVEDVAVPDPGPGEVLIRVEAAALNFFDTLISRGNYQHKPALPFSPSGEIGGRVERVGTGVTRIAPGDRVAAYIGWGGARELALAKAETVVRIPDGVSDIVASCVAITYGTALHGLKDRGRLAAGETVAVLGASGGAGLAAIEIAKVMGAHVIAVASGAEKMQVCRDHGADELIDYAASDLKSALRAASAGQGVDVVYDCVGGDLAEPALRALAWGGRYLVVGFAAGAIPKIPLNLLLLRGASAVGVFWGEAVTRDPEEHRCNMDYLLGAVAEGRLKPRIHATFPLAQTAEAIRVLDRRQAVGKVVLTVNAKEEIASS